MAPLSEREKVNKIFKALEHELSGKLFLGDPSRPVGEVKIIRRGFGTELGRPDVVIWVELELHVLGVRTSLRVPVLVEAEDAGIAAAREDFVKFFERDALTIPMIVVGKSGVPRLIRTEAAQANVQVEMVQIGFDRITTDEPHH